MTGPTPGPWRWEVHPGQHRVSLVGGKPTYDKTVMFLQRWGMQGASPIFREADGLLAERIEPMLVPIPGREHHEWIRLIDHPDARLIEAAPELLAALKAIVDDYSYRPPAGSARNCRWCDACQNDGIEYHVEGCAIAAARAAIKRAEGK